MGRIILLVIIHFLSFLYFAKANDTIKIENFTENFLFKGVMRDSLYYGCLLDEKSNLWKGQFDTLFNQYIIFSDSEGCYTWLEYDGNNAIYTKLSQDIYISQDLGYLNRDSDIVFAGSCYNPEDRTWQYGLKWKWEWDNKLHGIIINGDGYTITENQTPDEPLVFCWFNYIIYFFIICFFVYCFIKDFLQVTTKKEYLKIPFWISIIITIILYIIIPSDVLYYQFVMPGIFFLVGRSFYNSKLSLYNVLYLLMLYVTVGAYVYYNNFFTKEFLDIDGKMVEFNWKPGTGPLKRYLVRSELCDLLPVYSRNVKGKDIVVEMQKKTISERLYMSVNGDHGWWIYCFSDRKLNKYLTHRETINFINKLREVTGVYNFDLPQYQEIVSFEDQYDNCVSDENQFELTDTYIIGKRAISDNFFVNSYDEILTVFRSNKSDSINLLPIITVKDMPVFSGCFRLVYRPNKQGQRSLKVCGISVSNPEKKDSIIIHSIDGNAIDTLSWSIAKEQIIESFYKNCTMEISRIGENEMTLVNHKMKTLDYYYIPIFHYY